jgi:hypothetical protein
LDIHTTKEPNEVAYKPSAAGLGIQKTPTEVAHRPWAASLRLPKTPSEVKYRPSAAGLVIQTTPNEVRLELFDGTKESTTVNYPHPWLLCIRVEYFDITNIVL